LIVLISFPLLAYFFKTKITVKGSQIVIRSGGHCIEGVLGPEQTIRLLLKDRGRSINAFSGDAMIAVMPLDKAEALRARYGDFFKCGEPGADQAIEAMEQAILIADNAYTRDKISQAMALLKQGHIPIVSLRVNRLLVQKLTNFKIEVIDNTGTDMYYVRSLEILMPNYL
jgi:hypothetical protein